MNFKERILGVSTLQEADQPSFTDSPVGNPSDKDKPAPETGSMQTAETNGQPIKPEPKNNIKNNFSDIMNTTVGFRGDPDNKGDGKPEGMVPTDNDLASSARKTSTFSQRYNNPTSLQG